jgi:hypothetical protein
LVDESYRLVIEADDDGRGVAVVRATRQIPVDWVNDAGEIVDGLRSALDHLVYQLAIDSQIIQVSESTRTQFPIFLDHDEYVRAGRGKSWREKMLVGVARKHRRIIDDLQPYQRHRPSKATVTVQTSSVASAGCSTVTGDPLALLRALSDRNKHREPLRAYAFIPTAEIQWEDPSGVHGLKVLGNPETDREDGDIVINAPIVTLPDGTKHQTEIQVGEARFDIAFEGDLPVGRADLDRIVLHISRIIDRFDARIRR